MDILFFMAAGCLFFAQLYFSAWPLVTSLVSMSMLTFGNGFLLPLGTAFAIASHPQAAGAASGLMRAVQLGNAAISAALLGRISGHDPCVFAMLLALLCIVGFIIYIKLRDRYVS